MKRRRRGRGRRREGRGREGLVGIGSRQRIHGLIWIDFIHIQKHVLRNRPLFAFHRVLCQIISFGTVFHAFERRNEEIPRHLLGKDLGGFAIDVRMAWVHTHISVMENIGCTRIHVISRTD